MTTLTLAEALQHAARAGRGSLSDLDTLLRHIVAGEAGEEIQFLDGVVAGTGAASKALVLDSDSHIAIPGEVELDGNVVAVSAGAGITAGSGTLIKTSVIKIGSIIYTKILIYLDGLSSATTDLDIIGIGAAAPATLCQITAARNGTILSGKMTCLEAPLTGITDIDLYASATGLGATTYFEADIASISGAALVTAGGAWTLGEVQVLTGLPAADTFLYLVNGTGDTAVEFTAGKFLIELEGYDA